MGREHVRNMALLHRRVTLTALADDFAASRAEAEARGGADFDAPFRAV